MSNEASSPAGPSSPKPQKADHTKDSTKKRKRIDKEKKEQEEDEDLLEIDVDAPEPLSKAEARAAKKRAKKGLPELPVKKAKVEKKPKRDSDDEGESDKEAQRKEQGSKRQNSIWVGNLAFKTTQDTLRQFFENGIEAAGGQKLGCVTRINLPKKKTGKADFAPNKGFAYVDFATPELQALAVGLSESFFEGRKLLIKLGNDHVPLPNALTPKPIKAKQSPFAASTLKRQQHPESSTLFVGNLGFDATEEGLRDFIEANAAAGDPSAPVKSEEPESDDDSEKDGETEKPEHNPRGNRGGEKSGLRKVRLGAFEDTGKCKGFAFLDFYKPEDATRTLINRNNHFFGNRKLNMQYASPAATKRSGGPANREKEGPKRTERPENGVKASWKLKGYVDKVADHAQEGQEGEHESEPKRFHKESYGERKNEKDQRGKKWETTGRPRPGAALAMAKREKVGIVESQGAKVVFD